MEGSTRMEKGIPAGIDVSGTARPRGAEKPAGEVSNVFSLEGLGVSYGGSPAVEDVTFDLREKEITAFIGPSGCGKSTVIRCLNRMNDLIPSASVQGKVLYHGQDLYADDIDPVQVRKRIGMVFQKPDRKSTRLNSSHANIS